MTNVIDEIIKKDAAGKVAAGFGARYFPQGVAVVDKSQPEDLYSYTLYHGRYSIDVEQGDSVLTLEGDDAFWLSGPIEGHVSERFAVVLRGYQCGDKTVSLGQRVNLPYVNGCATRQLFPPERVGDPTLQQLTIPPWTSEQMHHIHPTARVVFVLSGQGWSIVGQSGKTEETQLLPGMTCVLDPMCPHHFRTEDDYLTVLPVHIFSSTPPSIERAHPMFNGTVEI